MLKNKRKFFFILGVLLLICFTIGYAYLNTTLVINGNSNVSKNTWDIHFDNILIDDGSVIGDEPEMTSDTITFDTTLSKPGDFYRFTVDLVNDGTLNAEIEKIEFTSNLVEEVADFLILNVTYEDGTSIEEKQYLLSESSKKIIFNLEYSTEVVAKDLPKENFLLNFTLKVIYKQPDYEPDAQINTIRSTSWNQRPGISMYNAINTKYKNIKAGEYFITDLDFSKDVFLDKNGKVLNLKNLMIKGGKTYTSSSYVRGAKISEEMMLNGNHDTIFIRPLIYGESEYDRNDNGVAVFVDPSDTYQNVVHAAFMLEFLTADLVDANNIENLEQEIIEEYILGFHSGQDSGCNGSITTTHKFYLFGNEEDFSLKKMTDKINHLDESVLCLINIPEEEMTYEEAKVFVVDFLHSILELD